MILRKKPEAFAESGIDDEWILMNVDTGHFHSVSGVALDVWNAIDGTRTLDVIQSMMADRYAIDRETCAAEVATFVGELRAAGFVDGI